MTDICPAALIAEDSTGSFDCITVVSLNDVSASCRCQCLDGPATLAGTYCAENGVFGTAVRLAALVRLRV